MSEDLKDKSYIKVYDTGVCIKCHYMDCNKNTLTYPKVTGLNEGCTCRLYNPKLCSNVVSVYNE